MPIIEALAERFPPCFTSLRKRSKAVAVCCMVSCRSGGVLSVRARAGEFSPFRTSRHHPRAVAIWADTFPSSLVFEHAEGRSRRNDRFTAAELNRRNGVLRFVGHPTELVRHPRIGQPRRVGIFLPGANLPKWPAHGRSVNRRNGEGTGNSCRIILCQPYFAALRLVPEVSTGMADGTFLGLPGFCPLAAECYFWHSPALGYGSHWIALVLAGDRCASRRLRSALIVLFSQFGRNDVSCALRCAGCNGVPEFVPGTLHGKVALLRSHVCLPRGDISGAPLHRLSAHLCHDGRRPVAGPSQSPTPDP